MTNIKTIPQTLWCALLLGLTLSATAAWSQDVLVVANKGVSSAQISATELREIFTGVRSRFSDGTRAVPVLLKGGPVHEVFLHHHLDETPDEFRARWRKVVFTGQGSMLKEFSSEAKLLDYVAATPGAIGYVSRLSAENSVKVLTVAKTSH